MAVTKKPVVVKVKTTPSTFIELVDDLYDSASLGDPSARGILNKHLLFADAEARGIKRHKTASDATPQAKQAATLKAAAQKDAAKRLPPKSTRKMFGKDN